MATIQKTHTFVKYEGGGNLAVAGLPWLPGQVQRIWSPSNTGASMTSAGYSSLGAWGGTLTEFSPLSDGYWIQAKTLGWELPAYLVKISETNRNPALRSRAVAFSGQSTTLPTRAFDILSVDFTGKMLLRPDTGVGEYSVADNNGGAQTITLNFTPNDGDISQVIYIPSEEQTQ